MSVRKCIRITKKKTFVGPAIGAAGLAFLLLMMGVKEDSVKEKGNVSMKSAFVQYIADEIQTGVFSAFMPVFNFAQSNGEDSWQRIVYDRVEEVAPLFYLGHEAQNTESSGTEKMTMEMILKAQAQEGNPGESLEALLRAENQAARGQLEDEQQTQAKTRQTQVETQQQAAWQIQAGDPAVSAFVPHTAKLSQVDMTSLADYDTLLQTFYTVDKSTMAGKELLNVDKMASADMTVSKEAEGPQILIYHTHSQEAFADSTAGDNSTTIVGVGERLTQILTETYGYQVLHHTAAYDLPSRDDAYSVALPEIEKILEENPQIQVVIDLHRDAMDESTRLVTEIDGRPTARFMFFNGLSRTKKTGNISYLYNENLEDNLAFSFQMQKAALEYYPGLTRKVYLKAYRYNMHLRPKNLLIELGAQNNTVEEAMNACDPLAHILDMVLSGQG